MKHPASEDNARPATPYLGLAPFLRMSIAGVDLKPVAQDLLAQAQAAPRDANLWMNLSIAMLCLGQRELGLAMQAQALELTRSYRIRAAQQPASLRVLMLMAPGDLAANTPLECLLEDSDVDLELFYLSESDPQDLRLPEHDVLFVALAEADEHRALLQSLERRLAHWSAPVINAPQFIPRTGRALASALLHCAPGLLIPATLQASRGALQAVARAEVALADLYGECDFPLIARPVGSHAGRDLARLQDPTELAAYLEQVAAPEFFIARFIDYSDADGLFRKFRVALIDGEPFACHMAVSSHWMVHYVNAGMYEHAGRRAEEAGFMERFDAFAQRHRAALQAVYQRTQLDYLFIDCAQSPDGELLVFEVDHSMVVHAMDSEQLFPHKQVHMFKVKQAVLRQLRRRAAQRTEQACLEH